MEEGIACYKTYLRGLLDITDNIVQGKIVPPAFVVRHDEDDPYLVVAADKGTATFSDYANSVSAEYHFWLDDAFASGGSAGYDHKKMGITAKGGWISVERHFQEMGVDIDKSDFTVMGIGDMAGDVFGNGMLLSKHIKLVGAFNHMHIFLDPNPDAAKSFAERERMFNLPRSSWADYNAKLISKGGGVFERSAKSIALTPEIRALLQIEGEAMAPDELIRAMLKAPVDLLWNGGIGTYVKATDETHEMVGDRTNNNLRIDGKDLRCKVVGEGGNLGFTQRGRIEYALLGGRINTDAIDNSAGVDCSDHEVNIKIALGPSVASGKLSVEQRDTLLASMTDDVARLVLKDNYLQTQAITMTHQFANILLESQARFMRELEHNGLLNRAIEYLPDEKAIAERRAQKKGLTRPELAVLLSYSKITLYNEILQSTLPDDAYFLADLIRYFPDAMRKDYQAEIEAHRLRREIVATVLTNSMVNRAGMTFFHSIGEDTGMPAADVARAYTIVRDLFGLREMWRAVEALDGKVPVEAQAEMLASIHRFLEQSTRWFLHNSAHPIDISDVMAEYGPGIREFTQAMPQIISPNLREMFEQHTQKLVSQNVPQELAARVSGLLGLQSGSDVVKAARETGLSATEVGKIYFKLGSVLYLGWLRNAASRAVGEGYWNRLALLAVIQDLFDQQRRLTGLVLKNAQGHSADEAVQQWLDANHDEVERFEQFVVDLRKSEPLDFAMLTVAQRHVQLLGSV